MAKKRIRPATAQSGVLVGPTDINGREGIQAELPGGKPIRVGGGEIIMNEKASTKYCKQLSKMNKETGGIEFDCDLQKVANTDRASGKMPKDEYHNENAASGIKTDSFDILSVLKNNHIYAEKNISFDVLSEYTKSIIDNFLKYDRSNPIKTRFNESIFFSPSAAHIKREGEKKSTIEYALHFITSYSVIHGSKKRIFDKSKFDSIHFLIPALTAPDVQRLIQLEDKKNGRQRATIYAKEFSIESDLCIVLVAEIEGNGVIRAITFIPKKQCGYIEKQKASGFWLDASVVLPHASEQPPAESAKIKRAGGGIPVDSNDKYNKKIESPINNLDKNGNIVRVALYKNGEFLKENGEKTTISQLYKLLQNESDSNRNFESPQQRDNGSIIEAVASELRRNRGASQADPGTNPYKRWEEEILIKSFPTPPNLDLKAFIDEGYEQKVFFKDDKSVIKLNSGVFYSTWEDYLNSLSLHNKFFPSTSYRLLGFMESADGLVAVVEQPIVKDDMPTKIEDIQKFMESIGFKRKIGVHSVKNDYYNPELGIILEDLHDGNVLTKEGKLYFIDTVFFTTPPSAAGGMRSNTIKYESRWAEEHPYSITVYEDGGEKTHLRWLSREGVYAFKNKFSDSEIQVFKSPDGKYLDEDNSFSTSRSAASGAQIPDRYKNMGFTHVGHVLDSTRPEKKWMVLAEKDGQYKVVHGGAKGMEDYLDHKDEERRQRFWDRMGGEDSPATRDPFSPLYWHKKIGTWETGGKAAAANAIKKVYSSPLPHWEIEVRVAAINAIEEIPEIDEHFMCTGECANISDKIKSQLNKKRIPTKYIDAGNINKGIVGAEHTALLLPDKNLIIDTQAWQYAGINAPEAPIETRKILFTPDEYKSLGFRWKVNDNLSSGGKGPSLYNVMWKKPNGEMSMVQYEYPAGSGYWHWATNKPLPVAKWIAKNNRGWYTPGEIYAVRVDNKWAKLRLETGGQESELKNQSQNKTKNEIELILSGKSEVRDGGTIQAALAYIRGNAGASDESKKERFDRENKLIEKFADKNDLWYSGILDEYKFIDSGTEQKVYKGCGQQVVKINNLLYYDSWSEYLINLLLHNKFFPDTSYRLLGFEQKVNGKTLPVVLQSFVEETVPTNIQNVELFLEKSGFKRVHRLMNVYENKELGIVIGDLHDGNVLTRHGILYFIDTKFYINSPERASRGIKEGTAVEMEHADTIRKIQQTPGLPVEKAAAMIAEDHIKEDPNYYQKLKEMENKAEVGHGKSIAKKSSFTIDDETSYPGYTFGEVWNGWDVPYFTYETAMQISKDMGGTFKNEAFEFLDDMGPYKKETISTYDGPKVVYPIGSGEWVWSEVQNASNGGQNVSIAGRAVKFSTLGGNEFFSAIKSYRETPEHFSNREVVLEFTSGGEERFPLSKRGDFLAGKPIEVKDSKGEKYQIELMKSIEHKAAGGYDHDYQDVNLPTHWKNVMKSDIVFNKNDVDSAIKHGGIPVPKAPFTLTGETIDLKIGMRGEIQLAVDLLSDVGNNFYFGNKYPDCVEVVHGAEFGDVSLKVLPGAISNEEFKTELKKFIEREIEESMMPYEPDMPPPTGSYARGKSSFKPTHKTKQGFGGILKEGIFVKIVSYDKRPDGMHVAVKDDAGHLWWGREDALDPIDGSWGYTKRADGRTVKVFIPNKAEGHSQPQATNQPMNLYYLKTGNTIHEPKFNRHYIITAIEGSDVVFRSASDFTNKGSEDRIPLELFKHKMDEKIILIEGHPYETDRDKVLLQNEIDSIRQAHEAASLSLAAKEAAIEAEAARQEAGEVRSAAEDTISGMEAMAGGGGGINRILNKYKKHIKEYRDSGIESFDDDNTMIKMFKSDYKDHMHIISLMEKGLWKQALRSFQNMDTASREEMTDDAYELLMEKTSYASGKSPKLTKEQFAKKAGLEMGSAELNKRYAQYERVLGKHKQEEKALGRLIRDIEKEDRSNAASGTAPNQMAMTLLDDYMTSKPMTWTDITRAPSAVTKDLIPYFKSLPLVEFSKEYSPVKDDLSRMLPPKKAESFIAKVDDKYYYCRSEGYNYIRYAVGINRMDFELHTGNAPGGSMATGGKSRFSKNANIVADDIIENLKEYKSISDATIHRVAKAHKIKLNEEEIDDIKFILETEGKSVAAGGSMAAGGIVYKKHEIKTHKTDKGYVYTIDAGRFWSSVYRKKEVAIEDAKKRIDEGLQMSSGGSMASGGGEIIYSSGAGKFRKSLLPLIKNALNTVGENPEDVVSSIEENLRKNEIEAVKNYVKYYTSDKNKEPNQEKAFKEYMKSHVNSSGASDGYSTMDGGKAKSPSIKKLAKFRNFWHARLESPKGARKCRVPEWAATMASAVHPGAKVTMCEKDGSWYPQNIMVPAKGKNKGEARRVAERIAEKLKSK